jgi:hypothetical protein
MSGSEALTHIRNVKKCNRFRAYKYLRDFCSQGVIQGRARGYEQKRDWYRDRGFGEEIPEDREWKEIFIYSDIGAFAVDQRQLNEFADGSEFDREDIVRTWPAIEAPKTELIETATLSPTSTPAALPPKPRGGKKAAPFWELAGVVASEWLDDNGCPAPGDGHQAELEKHITEHLGNQGHYPAESTIRRYVGRWIGKRRTELGIGGEAH